MYNFVHNLAIINSVHIKFDILHSFSRIGLTDFDQNQFN